MRKVVVLLPLLLCKYILVLVSYTPMMDDYIQLRSYPLMDADKVFFAIGTMYTRPLAAIFDYYIWSGFWDKLNIVVMIMVLLLFLIAVMLQLVFEHMKIPMGSVFYAFFLFAPISNEATVWLAASARIVVGLFFILISCVMLIEYEKSQERAEQLHPNLRKREDRKRIVWLFLFALYNMAGMLFYEQVAVVGVIIPFFILFRTNRKLITIPVVNICLVVGYYLTFQNAGVFGLRFENQPIPPVVYNNILNMLRIGIETFWLNISRGVFYLLGDQLLFIVVAVALFVALMFTQRGKFSGVKLVMGILLIIGTFSPFFFAGGRNICFRSSLCPLLGFALIFDCLPVKYVLYLILPLFMASNIADMNDYSVITQKDYRIVSYIANDLQNTEDGTRVMIGVKNYDVTKLQPILYHEHICSLFDTEWALAGALRALLENPVYSNARVYDPEHVDDYKIIYDPEEIEKNIQGTVQE